MSQNASTEKLYTAHEKDDADGGCPALDRVSDQKFSHDNEKDSCKGKQAGKKAEHGGSNKRYRGKSDNTIYCIQKKFPEGPFGFSSYPFHIFIGEPFGTETYPAKEPLGETIVFRQFQKGIDELSAHKPIISGSVN